MQARGLITGGVDFLLVETSQDALNIKAALEGIDRANADLGSDVPIAVQCTIETMGRCSQVRTSKLSTRLRTP